jgi:hypothetical protein
MNVYYEYHIIDAEDRTITEDVLSGWGRLEWSIVSILWNDQGNIRKVVFQRERTLAR